MSQAISENSLPTPLRSKKEKAVISIVAQLGIMLLIVSAISIYGSLCCADGSQHFIAKILSENPFPFAASVVGLWIISLIYIFRESKKTIPMTVDDVRDETLPSRSRALMASPASIASFQEESVPSHTEEHVDTQVSSVSRIAPKKEQHDSRVSVRSSSSSSLSSFSSSARHKQMVADFPPPPPRSYPPPPAYPPPPSSLPSTLSASSTQLPLTSSTGMLAPLALTSPSFSSWLQLSQSTSLRPSIQKRASLSRGSSLAPLSEVEEETITSPPTAATSPATPAAPVPMTTTTSTTPMDILKATIVPAPETSSPPVTFMYRSQDTTTSSSSTHSFHSQPFSTASSTSQSSSSFKSSTRDDSASKEKGVTGDHPRDETLQHSSSISYARSFDEENESLLLRQSATGTTSKTQQSLRRDPSAPVSSSRPLSLGESTPLLRRSQRDAAFSWASRPSASVYNNGRRSIGVSTAQQSRTDSTQREQDTRVRGKTSSASVSPPKRRLGEHTPLLSRSRSGEEAPSMPQLSTPHEPPKNIFSYKKGTGTEGAKKTSAPQSGFPSFPVPGRPLPRPPRTP